MKQSDQFIEGGHRTIEELLRQIRLSDAPDANIVRRLELESLSEFVTVDISIVTGLSAEEVLLVVECLRHFEFIHRMAAAERAEDLGEFDSFFT